MNDILLWRKISRIISAYAIRQNIPPLESLDVFYKSRVCALLHDPESSLQWMSDAYIVDEIILEKQQDTNV